MIKKISISLAVLVTLAGQAAEAKEHPNWRYVGHCVKKVCVLPAYLFFATPIAAGVWIRYGGYEKQLVEDVVLLDVNPIDAN